jgi:hypothetical protein
MARHLATSPFALLDAHASVRLVTDLVNEDDALSVALACRALRDALWGRFPQHPAGHPRAGTRLLTRDRLAAAAAAELEEAAATLHVVLQQHVDRTLTGGCSPPCSRPCCGSQLWKLNLAHGDWVPPSLRDMAGGPDWMKLGGVAQFRALAAYLRLREGELPLTKLCLSRTGLTAAAAGMFFGAVRARGCPGIKAVDVSDNKNLGGAGLASILAALGPALESIDFSESTFGDDAFEALAAAMPRLTSLKTIVAHDTKCGNCGVLALAAALPSAAALETLVMYHSNYDEPCGIDWEASSALKRAAAAAGVRRYSGPEGDGTVPRGARSWGRENF